jgi:hypothetical protein
MEWVKNSISNLDKKEKARQKPTKTKGAAVNMATTPPALLCRLTASNNRVAFAVISCFIHNFIV